MKKAVLLILFLSASFINFSFQQEQKVGLNIGDKAPELKLPGVDGKLITLSSLQGKMVLIDFWASWCGPCRMENPNLVLAYNKFKNTKFKNADGFEIYSISLDNQKEKWIAAIQKDNLYWTNHVSDLKWYYSEAAKTYKVNDPGAGLPSNFLIDGNGIIVAKRLIGRVAESDGSTSTISKIEAELTKHIKQ